MDETTHAGAATAPPPPRATRATSAVRTRRDAPRPLLQDGGRFLSLGPSRYLSGRPKTAQVAVVASAGEIRRSIRDQLPREPGVYAMIDREEAVAYVGMSRQLRERVVNYFVDKPGSAKEHRVGMHARRVLWQPVGHELTALLRELELIQKLRPRFNVKGTPDRGRSGYLALTDDDAPTFVTAHTPPSRRKRLWGPMLVTRRFRDAVDRMNHVFGLRDCTRGVKMQFRDQSTLFEDTPEPRCLRAAFGGCLAPCARGCSRAEYAASVADAVAFLEGRDGSVFERVDADMTRAAADQKYEKAARLRDTRAQLEMVDHFMAMLRDGSGSGAFVLPVPDGRGRRQWLMLTAGIVVAAVRQPGTPPQARAARQMVDSLRPGGRKSLAEQMNVDFECEAARTIAAWFRKNPGSMATALSLDEAAAACDSVAARAA